jgi:hypothetical protein
VPGSAVATIVSAGRVTHCEVQELAFTRREHLS